MNGFLDSTLLAAVLDAAVRGTFILLAALAGTSLMRRSSASARHLVWLAALTALLLLPIARGFVPKWRVLPAAPVFAAPAPQPVATPFAAPDFPDGAGVVRETTGAVVERASVPARLPIPWTTFALLLWAAGAAVLALRLAYGLARVRWIERHATELTDDGWVRLTDGLARRLGLGRIVRLLREPGATVPMTWGIFRPVILLPGEADGWDDERRRVVLAHELAHVRRWDALTQWIAHLVLAVFWFNPLVWVAVRRLRAEREHACDDAVLEIGTRPAEYADHLLNIVRSLGSAHGTTTAALAMARRSQFEGRLLAILDNAVRRNGVSRAAGLATAAAALACLLPLAAMRSADHPVATAELPAVADVRGMPVPDGTEDGASLGTPGPGEAMRELSADRETLAADRAELAARLSELDAQRASQHATLESADGAATAVLMQAAGNASDPGLYAEIIRASLDIRSATDRRLVLMRLLEQPDLGAENVVAIVAATRTMGSDTERRIVITHAMEYRAYPVKGAMPAPLVESLRGFSSATEQRIVLTNLMEQRHLDTHALATLLRVVPEMESDTERRLVLTVAAELQRVEGAAREAYLAAAGSIGSDTDRALALSALLDRTAAASHEAGSADSVWSSSNQLTGTRDGKPRSVRVVVRDAVFAGERWNVRGFRAGGGLLIEERLDGGTRRVQAECDGEGNPVWSYAVNGHPRAFDDAARGWMESIVRELPA